MNFSILLLLFLSLVGCQGPVFNIGGNVDPQKLENQMGSGHVCIAGTQICLDPPPGFGRSETFPGFEHNRFNALIVAVKAPFSFYDFRESFTASQLGEMGFTLLDEEKIWLGGKEGMIQTFRHSTPEGVFGTHFLTFGDDSSYIAINAVFPGEHADELDKALKECLLHTVYDPSATWDIEESMPFEISTVGTELAPWFGMGNGLSYIIDGNGPEDSRDGVVVALGASMGKAHIDNHKEFALENIEVYASVSNAVVASIARVEIDEMEGYEIVAHGIEVKSHRKAIVHEVFLFSEDYFYVIGSRATDEMDKHLAMFRKVSHSFRRKYNDDSDE